MGARGREMSRIAGAPDAGVARIATDALRELGADGVLSGWTAACEGGFIAERFQTPTVILGPGDINAQVHQPDESVEIDQLATTARAYALIALWRRTRGQASRCCGTTGTTQTDRELAAAAEASWAGQHRRLLVGAVPRLFLTCPRGSGGCGADLSSFEGSPSP